MHRNECCNGKGSRHHSIWKCIGWGLLGVVGFAIFVALIGIVIMSLWNWLLPTLFKFPEISYWQAVGLAVLSRLLFGGCGKGIHHWHGRRFHHRHECCCLNHYSDKQCSNDDQHNQNMQKEDKPSE